MNKYGRHRNQIKKKLVHATKVHGGLNSLQLDGCNGLLVSNAMCALMPATCFGSSTPAFPGTLMRIIAIALGFSNWKELVLPFLERLITLVSVTHVWQRIASSSVGNVCNTLVAQGTSTGINIAVVKMPNSNRAKPNWQSYYVSCSPWLMQFA